MKLKELRPYGLIVIENMYNRGKRIREKKSIEDIEKEINQTVRKLWNIK